MFVVELECNALWGVCLWPHVGESNKQAFWSSGFACIPEISVITPLCDQGKAPGMVTLFSKAWIGTGFAMAQAKVVVVEMALTVGSNWKGLVPDAWFVVK